jgi:hypothetical protein
MPSIVIRLDPTELTNPDADLRYLLPELIAERSAGSINDDGHDYLDSGCMLIFLGTSDLAIATPLVLDVVLHEKVLGNSLVSAVVGVADADAGAAVEYRTVYPADEAGAFAIS